MPDTRHLVMVGDRLDTDVAGACAAGMTAVLVLTGSTRPGDLAGSAIAPDLVLPSLAELVLT
ncbi:MAG: HAD hydrolase-like protein [Actinomycetota bacterium]|nr:HAD hydrolase-like protein [Actinomycetota bacterium]